MRHGTNIAITIVLAAFLAGPASSEEPKLAQAQAAMHAAPAFSVTMIDSSRAEGILGKAVRSKAGENIGRIIDVIVDRTGQTRAAVIDFGGFLGVGSRKIAVDWDALNFGSGSDKRDFVRLELTREQIKAAPEYKERRDVIVLGAAGPMLPASPH
jgi:hypothetical protein